MKIKRHEMCYTGDFWWEESDAGDWCEAKDVAKLEEETEDLKAEIEEWKCCEMTGAKAMTYLAGKLSTGGKPSTTWILEAIKKVSEE